MPDLRKSLRHIYIIPTHTHTHTERHTNIDTHGHVNMRQTETKSNIHHPFTTHMLGHTYLTVGLGSKRSDRKILGFFTLRTD